MGEVPVSGEKTVELFSTKMAFLMAGITSYAAGHMFLHNHPHLRPARKRRQLAWTREEIQRLQDAYWLRATPTPPRQSHSLDSVIKRAFGGA